MLNAIRGAQAPEKFTLAFLSSLDYKSSSDRLIISVLKALGFLDTESRPTERYFQYLDQTQSETVMAGAIRDAYSDLFQVNTKAHEMSRGDLKGKLKTLTQGTVKDSVIDKMAMTFVALVKHADFSKPQDSLPSEETADKTTHSDAAAPPKTSPPKSTPSGLFGGLHYNIQIILPSTRDTKVYDAIFRSMKEHLHDG